MKIYYLIVSLLISSLASNAQKFKEYKTCVNTAFHQGKIDHGRPYCVGWATIREHPNGVKDTVGWTYQATTRSIDESNKYEKLSKRNKYIVDSLREDKISFLEENYLRYEPIYMKPGSKKEKFWDAFNDQVVIYEYLFYNNKNGRGIRLVKQEEPK